jgi:hypothetical protein
MTETDLYRSPGLPAGFFRQVGIMHMHVDGAGYEDLVNSLVRNLEAGGARAKLTAVSQAVAGPQRAEEPDTYASHTPGTLNDEHLEYFSTTSLRNRTDAVQTIQKVLPLLAEHEGVVIEVERVIAKVDESGWRSLPVRDLPILGEDVGFVRNPTMDYELHHALEFLPGPQGTTQPPIRIEQLLADTTALGLKVGGWFNFPKKDGQWSFRSNAFTSVAEEDLEALVTKEYELLGQYAAEKHLQCQRWTIVEQVLGIWRSPFERLP